MPPRKRAASAPKAEPEEMAEPVVEEEDTDPAPEAAGDATPDEAEATPERGDLQTVDVPCLECFPGGWPAQGYAVGCTHGTWTREATG